MKAVTDEESDAMQMRFPCYVHGMLKMDSFSGVIRPDKDSARSTLDACPPERRVNETRLEVRYSPTLAGAMVDALPYLVEYPYGCTEQTLNRFLPTVITQRILQQMKLDLKDIQKKRTNLNAQEIGDDTGAGQGLEALSTATRSSTRTRSSAWSTAGVAGAGGHAAAATAAGAGSPAAASTPGRTPRPSSSTACRSPRRTTWPCRAGMLERGIAWLKNYQARAGAAAQERAGEDAARGRSTPTTSTPWSTWCWSTRTSCNDDMRDFLYRDRTKLAVYAKAMFGLALHKQQQAEQAGDDPQEHRAVRRRRTTRTRRPT